MNTLNSTKTAARFRRLCALAVAVLLYASPLPAAAAQHEGHNMPSSPPARQTRRKKPAPRKATPRKAAPTRRRTARKGARPKPPPTPAAQQGDDHTLHQTAPGMPQPTATPAASDPHAGHAARPVATPPQPAPAVDHSTHQMPSQQPAATPTPRQTPAPAVDHSTHQMPQPRAEVKRAARRADLPEGPVVSLEDLERMAAERNPTLAQAESAVRAAEGRRRQAGLFPNPVVGYSGDELAFRAPGERSVHGVFVEQTIPLGGKLGKAKRVFEREREQAEAVAQAQRQRVLNSVRVLYYDALAAQRLVELRADLADLSREAVEITKELYNVGQADRPDQLEIEIEAERAEVELLRARTDREQVWRVLGATVGNPALRPSRLAGNLEEGAATLDQEQVLDALLRESPEVRASLAGVERARAVLARARAQRVPDLFVRGGVGYSNEVLESDGRKTGAEGSIEVGVNVPIFNRNQGGIAAAEAELAIAERETERLQLSLRSRLASSFREYRNAQQTVERYRTRIIPRARQAYDMYLSNFRQMAASYPQVLIAQRTLFQVEVEYARSLVELRRGLVGLRGFLLSGGLEAVGRPGESGGESRDETFRVGGEPGGEPDDE